MASNSSKFSLIKVLRIAAIGAIVAGVFFVIEYPRKVARDYLDAERLVSAQELEQALEWYLIIQAREKQQEQVAAEASEEEVVE